MKPKDNKQYVVLALIEKAQKYRWIQVTTEPMPRPTVAHAVAAEWQKGRIARAVAV